MSIEYSAPQHEVDGSVAVVLQSCQAILSEHQGKLVKPISMFEDDELEELLDRIEQYVSFEVASHQDIRGIPVQATGLGMLRIADPRTGKEIGAEVISNGDVVEGRIESISVGLSPTLACLYDCTDEGIHLFDRVMAVHLYVASAVYKTGLNKDGSFTAEHDLSSYDIVLPLVHQLGIAQVVK